MNDSVLRLGPRPVSASDFKFRHITKCTFGYRTIHWYSVRFLFPFAFRFRVYYCLNSSIMV